MSKIKPKQPALIHWVLDHPKLAGFLALIALAVSFAPKSSSFASWICLGLAEVFVIAMLAGTAEKQQWGRVREIALMVLSLLLVVGFGLWLTDGKKGIEEWYSRWLGSALPKQEVVLTEKDLTRNSIDGLTYVRIPSGAFLMGCSRDDIECLPEEKPARKVTVNQFKMGQTEVTVRAYRLYLQSEAQPVPKSISTLGDDEPAGYATWADADGYCRWSGGRLPSEAEWEYAARGGSTTSRN